MNKQADDFTLIHRGGPVVTVVHVGMSTETTIFATVEIILPPGTEDFPTPTQKLDEGEFVSELSQPISAKHHAAELMLDTFIL